MLAYASIETDAASCRGSTTTRVLVEAKLLWGRNTIAVRHVAPRRELRVADLALDILEGAEIVVARRDDSGEIELCLPSGAAVPPGCLMSLKLGRATLRVALVADDVAAPPRPRVDVRVAYAVIGAAALHLAVMGLVALGRAPAGDSEQTARVTMQGYMAAAEERALADLAAAQAEHAEQEAREARDREALAAAAKATSKTDGARPLSARANDRGAERGPDEVASFGMLAILAADGRGRRADASPFAAERGPRATGNIFGATIDDAAGAQGLGLSGVGEAGGGKGAGIPLAIDR